MSEETQQVLVILGFFSLLGVACLATHSAEPLWLLWVVLFLL